MLEVVDQVRVEFSWMNEDRVDELFCGVMAESSHG
jgi:hypothetical protein